MSVSLIIILPLLSLLYISVLYSNVQLSSSQPLIKYYKNIVLGVYIKNYKNLIMQVGLLGLILSLLMISLIWLNFNSNEISFQGITNILSTVTLGYDGNSIFFIMLTGLIMPIALLSNWYNLPQSTHNEKGYTILILLLDVLLLTNFLILDIIGFYIFFESILAPFYILIGIYGSTNKEKAALYLLIYTLASSLLMLLGICMINILAHSTSFVLINNFVMSLELQSVIWLAVFIAIMVKTPIFPVHGWLPVVHSESPLGGSIILAGIVLKLAIYAIMRILLPLLSEATVLFVPLVYVISGVTVIYTCLATIRQTDTKVIIAYSSISHMAVCLLGIFANNLIGLEGSIMLGLAHGFVSPALFICVGGILYDRYHTRIAYLFQGLATYLPIFCTYLFIFSLANIGTPLSGNFLGEFLSLAGAYQRSPILTLFGVTSVLLSAIYMMRFTSKILGGIKPKNLPVTKDLSKRELTMMNVLLVPVLLLGIVPNFLFTSISSSISTLLYIV